VSVRSRIESLSRGLHPGSAATTVLVRVVERGGAEGSTPPRGLRRRLLLATIFRAMPRRVDPRRAAGADAVVEWRIRDGEGGVDIWTTTFADGRCRARRGGAERPRMRIELGTGDFLALVTGNADGPALFFAGRIQIEGDLMFAGRLASMFHVVRA
jgi:SCP-2 sterol transfer family protein